MAELYAQKWTSAQPDTPTDGWLLALDGLSAADVGVGLLKLRESGPDWPPSAVEFRRLCLPEKRENAAAYRMPPSHLLPKLVTDDERAKGRAELAKIRELLA